MPLRSRSQFRWMARREPAMFRRWRKEYPGQRYKDLPEKAAAGENGEVYAAELEKYVRLLRARMPPGAEGWAWVQPDLCKEGLSVPLGSPEFYYEGRGPLPYRWKDESHFEVYYKDKWIGAMSGDWVFDKPERADYEAPDVHDADFGKFIDILKKPRVPGGPVTYDQLRYGDLVKVGFEGVYHQWVLRYGVVVHIGGFEQPERGVGASIGDKTTVWAVWGDTLEDAKELFYKHLKEGEGRSNLYTMPVDEYRIIERGLGEKKAAPEVFDAGFSLEKFRDLMTPVPKGIVDFKELRIGDLIEDVSDLSDEYRFGVIVRLDPVGKGKEEGQECLVWSYWEADPEAALSSLKKKKITWSTIGETSTYVTGCKGARYRIHRRGIVNKAAPEVHEAELGKYIELLKKPPIPREPVSIEELRVGDLVEMVPHKGSAWNFFIVAAVVEQRGSEYSNIYALFGDGIEDVKKRWSELRPDQRNSINVTENDQGAVLSWVPDIKYRIYERGMHLKKFDAPVELEKFGELLKPVKGRVDISKVRKGDLVHVVDNTYPGNINYGVIVFIGEEGHATENVGDGALWAIWRNNPAAAVMYYLEAMADELNPYEPDRGRLLRQVPYGKHKEYYILERNVDKRRKGRKMDAPVELERYTKLLKKPRVPREIRFGDVRVGDMLECHLTDEQVKKQKTEVEYVVVGHIGELPMKAPPKVWGRGYPDSIWGVWGKDEESVMRNWVGSDLDDWIDGRALEFKKFVLLARLGEKKDAPVELERYGELLKKQKLPRPIAVKDVRVGDLLFGMNIKGKSTYYLEVVAIGDTDGRPYFISSYAMTPEKAHEVVRELDMVNEKAKGFVGWARNYDKGWTDLKLLRRPVKAYSAPVELEKFRDLLFGPSLPKGKVNYKGLRVGDLFEDEPGRGGERYFGVVVHIGHAPGALHSRPRDTVWSAKYMPTKEEAIERFKNLTFTLDKDVLPCSGISPVFRVHARGLKRTDPRWVDFRKRMEGKSAPEVSDAPVEFERFEKLLKPHPFVPKPVKWNDLRVGDIFRGCYNCHKKKDNWWYGLVVAVEMPISPSKPNHLYIHFGKTEADAIKNPRTPTKFETDVDFGKLTLVRRGVERKKAPETEEFEAARKYSEAEDQVTVYHGTTVKNLKRIIDTGRLDPRAKLKHPVWTSGVTAKEPRTYVTLNASDAWFWSGGAAQDKPGAVLKFRVAKNRIYERRLPGAEGMGLPDYYICFTVPVKDIQGQTVEGGPWRPLDAVTFEAAGFEDYVKLLTRQSKPVTLRELEAGDLVRALKTMYYQGEWKEGTINEARTHKEWFTKGTTLRVTTVYGKDFCARLHSGIGYMGEEMCYLWPKYFEYYQSDAHQSVESPGAGVYDAAEFEKYVKLLKRPAVPLGWVDETQVRPGDLVRVRYKKPGSLDWKEDDWGVVGYVGPKGSDASRDPHYVWGLWSDKGAGDAYEKYYEWVFEKKVDVLIRYGVENYPKVEYTVLDRDPKRAPPPGFIENPGPIPYLMKNAPEVNDARPMIVYHITPTKNLDSIMKKGLVLGAVRQKGSFGPSHVGIPEDLIYVFSKRGWEWLAQGGKHMPENVMYSILELRVDKSFLSLDEDWTVSTFAGGGSVSQLKRFLRIYNKYFPVVAQSSEIIAQKVRRIVSDRRAENLAFIRDLEKEFAEESLSEMDLGVASYLKSIPPVDIREIGRFRPYGEDRVRWYKKPKWVERYSAPDANRVFAYGTLKEQYTPPRKAMAQGPSRGWKAPAQDTKEDLKAYLEAMVKMRSMMKLPADWKYNSMEEFVLRNGHWYEPVQLPKGIKRGKMKDCFMNATNLILKDYPYVEGFALRPGLIAVNHAWNTDKEGHAIDPTWGYEPDTAYFGVPFSEKYVFDTILKKETYGVIDNVEGRWPLITGKDVTW